MRRFKTTPQKKFLGMIILFVFIPLFLLWYIVFFLDNKPGLDTLILLGTIIVLGFYFYRRYKKQIDALAAATQPKAEPLSEPVKEDLSEEELDEEVEDSFEEKQK